MTDTVNNVAIENFKATFIDGLRYKGIMAIAWLGLAWQKHNDCPPNKKRLIQK